MFCWKQLGGIAGLRFILALRSCSLEKDMGLQSPVYNLRILNVLKESYVWGDGVDITLDKVFIVFPTLLTRSLCPFNSDSPHAQIGVQSKKLNRKNIFLRVSEILLGWRVHSSFANGLASLCALRPSRLKADIRSPRK